MAITPNKIIIQDLFTRTLDKIIIQDLLSRTPVKNSCLEMSALKRASD